jgi:hypothetical protein
MQRRQRGCTTSSAKNGRESGHGRDRATHGRISAQRDAGSADFATPTRINEHSGLIVRCSTIINISSV